MIGVVYGYVVAQNARSDEDIDEGTDCNDLEYVSRHSRNSGVYNAGAGILRPATLD